MRRLTWAELRGLPSVPLRTDRPMKPDLLLYEVGGERIVLKDYGSKPQAWLRLWGSMTTRREARALRALRGVRGVPALRGRPGPFSVAMSYVPGERACAADPRLRGNERFLEALEDVVRQVHARGVVHLDLKHRSNLHVSAEGAPVILDFESALCFDPRSAIGRLAVWLLGRFDWMAVMRWRRRLCRDTARPGRRIKTRRLRRRIANALLRRRRSPGGGRP